MFDWSTVPQLFEHQSHALFASNLQATVRSSPTTTHFQRIIANNCTHDQCITFHIIAHLIVFKTLGLLHVYTFLLYIFSLYTPYQLYNQLLKQYNEIYNLYNQLYKLYPKVYILYSTIYKLYTKILVFLFFETQLFKPI